MTLLERIDPGDGIGEIEPGRRLIRAQDHGPSLASRLALGISRLAARTPFRIRGRGPLRLTGVPKDPIAGDKAVGDAILKGVFVHGGRKLAVAELDFSNPALPPALGDWLHSFAWLRDLAAAATRERASKLAERVLEAWLKASPADRDGTAWRPDLAGRRILFWSAYAPYILSSRDRDYRAAVLGSLARAAAQLNRSADKAPPGVARLSAWSGSICASLILQGAPVRLAAAEAGFSRALISGMHDDGGLVSRSPTEQLMLVELLSQLRAVYYAARRELPEALGEALAGAVAALVSLRLGDGALSSWQGGGPLSSARIEAALEGTGIPARPLRQARGWGYQRLEAKGIVAIMDAAPPPPARMLRGSCASTLAFELSDGPNRLVVNCGGVGGSANLSNDLVLGLRSTAAHSTLALAERNSTAVNADGSLGRGVAEVELSRDETGGVTTVEASHDGYVRRFGLAHQRQLTLSSDGGELRGEDRLIASGKKRRRAEPIAFAVRFHLAPSVEATSTADGKGALLRRKGAPVWQFRCRGGALSIEESLWIDGRGRPQPSQQLVIAGETPAEGISLSWQLRRGS